MTQRELQSLVNGLSDVEKVNLLELLQKHPAVKALNGLGGPGLRNDEPDDMVLVMEVIVDVLRAKGVGCSGVQQLRRSASYSSFKVKVAEVLRVFRGQGLKQKNQLRSILKMGVSLLYDDLCQVGIAATGTTLMNHIHRVPAVVNRQFPGYLQYGLLYLVVRDKKHKKRS